MGLGITRVEITYGGESVIMSWDGSEASAPIRVDGETTQYQTASARHRTANAVLLAARYAWPETEWPEVPLHGSESIESNEAWDELSYETLEDEETETVEDEI